MIIDLKITTLIKLTNDHRICLWVLNTCTGPKTFSVNTLAIIVESRQMNNSHGNYHHDQQEGQHQVNAAH